MNRMIISVLIFSVSVIVYAEEKWSIGQAKVDNNPVVYKYISELPEKKIRNQMPWLTVISWKYDGVDNNGMPPKKINQTLNKLEDGLENIADRGILYYMVYAVTGNNHKEFVFYISDREKFMNNFNQALYGHAAYPIEVSFYQDKTWKDLVELHQGFGETAEQ